MTVLHIRSCWKLEQLGKISDSWCMWVMHNTFFIAYRFLLILKKK